MEKEAATFKQVLSVFPENKRTGEQEALLIWRKLPQQEREEILKHAQLYVKNTNEHFITQLNNYFRNRTWTKELKFKNKNPMFSRKELLDGNFLSFIQDTMELPSIEETTKTLVEYDVQTLQEIYYHYLDYKSKKKKYSIGDIVVQRKNEHGVTYFRDDKNKHYFGLNDEPLISLSNEQFKKFCDNLYTYRYKIEKVNGHKIKTIYDRKKIQPNDLTSSMLYCIKDNHNAQYSNTDTEIIDVKYLQHSLF